MNRLIKVGISLIFPFLGSCAQMVMKSHGFQETEAVTINGAKVRSGVKAMGGSSGFAFSAMVYAAGTGTLDGPFLWRVEAEGREGVHEWLRVNKIRVRTRTTKRDEWYPRDYLGVNAPFESLPGKEGVTFAKYQIPGKLKVMSREDGEVEMLVDVSVKANGRVQSKVVRFVLQPESKWDTETIFLPTEIVQSFQGNPRGWDW